jgi:acyl-CoA thioester hydrolase
MISTTNKLKVRYQETDRMGVAYHSNYFIWFEIGRTELFKTIGISYLELEKMGYFLVVTEANCKYKAPVTYEDEIEVLTRLAERKNSLLTFDYEVRRGDVLTTTGRTKHAFVDANCKVIRMPKVVIEALGS